MSFPAPEVSQKIIYFIQCVRQVRVIFTVDDINFFASMGVIETQAPRFRGCTHRDNREKNGGQAKTCGF